MSFEKWNKLAATRGIGAVSIFAGLVAMAAAIEVHEPPTLASSTTWTSGPQHESPLSSARMLVLPRMTIHGVVNRGDATHRSVASPPPADRASVAERGSVATCDPVWRPLESGPVGRMVVETCPGQHAIIPPMPPHAVDSGRSKLPTVAELVAPIVKQPAESIGLDAKGTDQRLAASLEGRIEKDARRPAPLAAVPDPDLGALDWAPNPSTRT